MRKVTKEEFIERAVATHGGLYSYGKVEMNGMLEKVIITCPKHGDFLQRACSHLAGDKCPKCRKESYGWTHRTWAALKGEHKLYAILFTSEDEKFVKIGKTSNSLKRRYKSLGGKYEYKVISIIKASDSDSAIELSQAEAELKKLLSPYRYTPKKEFYGKTECFTTEVITDPVFEEIFKLSRIIPWSSQS